MSEIISEAKLAANRATAQKSTGPRTAEGKDASKLNGLKHGLSSPLVVLPCEDQNEYNAMHQAFLEEYTPVSPTEEALVKQIADSQWKMRRLEKLEARVFDKLMETTPETATADPFEAMANNLLAPGKGGSVLAQLARYQASLNRQFHQSINDLRKLQKDRVDEYCRNLKREALHLIGGRSDQTHENKLAFHLMAEDPGCIGRYIDTETEATAVISKRERNAA